MDSMIQWLADQCDQNRLAEKWLVADTMRIAQQWKDRINLAGSATLNLHCKTLRTMVVSLATNLNADQSLTVAGDTTVRILVRSVLGQLWDDGQLKYFRGTDVNDGLSNLLARSIQDLRLAEVGPESIVEGKIDSPAKADDIRRVYQAYCQRLQDHRIADYAGCIDLVHHAMANGTMTLPGDLRILIPEQPPLSRAEQRLMKTIGKLATCLHPGSLDPFGDQSEPVADRIAADRTAFAYFSGFGEVNEVRGVFERIIAGQSGQTRHLDDVEILHTDQQQYVPLILEQISSWMAEGGEADSPPPDLDSLPVTFAEGIACIYSRPGRALRSWLRWARHDFVQSRAVQLIREGLVVRPTSGKAIGYSRLADALRKVPIGFRVDRYLPKLQEAIESANASWQQYQQNGDSDSPSDIADDPPRDFGRESLRTVQAMVKPLVQWVPGPEDDAAEVLRKARRFLLESARAANQLDRYVRDKLLDDIDGMQANLKLTGETNLDLIPWLEELPLESRILASGPRPGRVHVAPLALGGHSGRRAVFLVGLDDGRHPKRIGVDPIVLDAERERLSANLRTSAEISATVGQTLERALFRILSDPGANVWLSYSARDLVDDRDRFPSASMLEVFRITSGEDGAQLDDLLKQIGRPVGFVSQQTGNHLATADRHLARLLGQRDPQRRQDWLQQHFEHSRFQRCATEAHAADEVSEYDGLVSAAGGELDPTIAKRVSPSRLETFGACPRRYLFRYGLGVYPPDEWTVDPERWLDPLQFGNLVHGLFERFLRQLTAQDRTPNLARDRQPLLELLGAMIEQLKSDVPVPNEDALRRTCGLLEETCEIFLQKEEEYCDKHHARPWVLEASMGLQDEGETEIDSDQPIPLMLSDGRLIRLSGRIDRVDQLLVQGSQRYAIWDYKSGSSYGFDQQNPFQQGRKLQPFLYMGMLRHRLTTLGQNADAVESFGYFFPSPKTDGLRLRWTRAQLASGDDVLRDISDLIAAGLFPPTTDPGDCSYCDYAAVCGDAQQVAQQSLRKCSLDGNTMLQPYRRLREIADQQIAARENSEPEEPSR